VRRFGFEEWLWVGLLAVAVAIMVGVTIWPLLH
jgi:hypothetical protein